MGNIAAHAVLRHIGIQQQAFAGWGGGSLTRTQTKCTTRHEPAVEVYGGGVTGAALELSTAPAWLYSLHYLHSGGPRYWVVVPPRYRRQLEQQLLVLRAARYPPQFKTPPCSQFARHLGVWVPLERLSTWGIEYTVVQQHPGELVVLMPGVYSEGWTHDEIVSETAYLGDNYSPRRYVSYDECRWGCELTVQTWDPDTQQLRRRPEAEDPTPDEHLDWTELL